MIYKCSWSIINGLILDELVLPDDQKKLIDNGFNSTGILEENNTVYYIKAVNGSRDNAIDILKEYIKHFMRKCIREHEDVLNDARTAWKKCK